ncbi:putative phage abortive infection protein [Thalassobius sp. I31.1]|uniref:putative phage abortive infection protein n=1 Tax=Thalassobius sp. I31.1 TaxID=2109912 RepID=UPI000D1B2623|nr:putative phage abortive infection protein [Thalassobius sp. I31.1]
MSEEKKEELSWGEWLASFWSLPLFLAILCTGIWGGVVCSIAFEPTPLLIFFDGPTPWDLFWEGKPNEMGDTLAGLTGVLVMIWVIASTFLQRSELRQARDEYAKMAKAGDDQASALAVQNFDNLVFEMIATHNSIVSSMDITTKKQPNYNREYENINKGNVFFRGRDCFRFFYKQIEERQLADRLYDGGLDLENTLKRYEAMYESHSSDLGHYFRFIHNMFRVIEESNVPKQKHKKLVRALFSDDELLVIFYNALTSRGEKMVQYIESFELFDNLPQERLVELTHKDSLSAKCFGEKAK